MKLPHATVQWAGDDLLLGTSPSGHAQVIDFRGERSSGPSPTELLLLSLGACGAADVISILHKKRQVVTAYRVEVKGERHVVGENAVILERRGADVLVLEGFAEAALANPAAFWKCVKKSEMTGFERLRKFVCEKDGVKEAFSGKCPTCGKPLAFDDDQGKPKPKDRKKKEFSVEPR